MLVLIIAIAAQVSAIGARQPPLPATATVTRARDKWQIEYRLTKKSSAWVFPVSQPRQADHNPWREEEWRVVTPGVRIERRGAYDVLVSTGDASVPLKIRIAFTPTSATLDREYDPAVTFSNGATALYSDQFDVVPIADLDAIGLKQAGLSVEELGGTHTPVRFHDAKGPVFVQGYRQRNPILTGAETYVVFGTSKIEERNGLAMLADPALPEWLKAEVAGFAPQVAATYAARLGRRTDPSLPLLLMGWRGPTAGKVINDGGVRPGQILFNFEGEGLIEPNERAARRTRWFIAHEMAHFWLGTSGIGYRMPSEAWITEGGAEMMAFTLLAASDHDYALSELQRAVEDCIKFAIKPIAGAGDRHESRAFYACGATFALAAASAVRRDGGRDYFDFIQPLLEDHRSDRLLGSIDWVRHFAAVSGEGPAVHIMTSMLDAGVPDPAEAIEKLFRQAGVPYSRNAGSVMLAPNAI
ncbi:hypothetical protein [Sphingomonas oligophenolica]|uniref:Peptidase M1 membrane alanine aminopeptidase domain-containing protein n=1 Tax=Sphingomonas oligophenolica TaxID=301154 RepID=A0A502CHJ9_9SPHN|nr:hypothetical protein [Sphingomonas oligophenolica]TPG12120.1 hypothetical protein EAH84_10240 [Sphingomonas oligophenolica]